jgi:hypothetical protein
MSAFSDLFACSELILLEAFVLLWSHTFVHACGQISIAGSVSEWYFDKASSSGSVFAALHRALRFHVGTAALGSFLRQSNQTVEQRQRCFQVLILLRQLLHAFA